MQTRILALCAFIIALSVPSLAGAESRTYTTSGTFEAPVGAIVNIQVIGGGGGGGGASWSSDPRGGHGGNGAGTSVSGSFGVITAPGGAGGYGGTSTGSYGSAGSVVSRTITLSDGEPLTISIGGGGGGGGGGGIGGVGPSGTNGSVGEARGGTGGLGGDNCQWSGSGHSSPARGGGTGGVSAGGGGGGGAGADNGSWGCATGESGSVGKVFEGGKGGSAYRYTNLPPGAPGGATVGAGGTRGSSSGDGAGGGASGAVVISWSVPAPTCSITFDQNPLTGNSTKVRWTSTNATLFYINNIGYVGGSGSATVFAPGNYSGTVTGAGGTADCSAVLSGVNQCVPATSSSGSGGGTGSSGGTTSGSAGSRTFSSPGTYSFAVPSYGTLTVEVKGAGGGGGGGGQVATAFENDAACGGPTLGQSGGTGGASSFGSVVGRGGTGGPSSGSEPGAAGTASGGDQNSTGGGASGGTGGQAGSSIGPCTGDPDGADGGRGGRAVKTYAAGELSGTVTVQVGGGGAGGAGGYYTDNSQYPAGENYNHPHPGNAGTAGSSGSVVITWTASTGSTGGGGGGGGSGGGGGTGQGSIVYTCGSDGNLRDSCGNVTACQYGCTATTNTCKKKNECVEYRVCDTSGMKVVNSCTGAVVENCAARGANWMCQDGTCVRPKITFVPFDGVWGSSSFQATGHLQARPTLLRPGQNTRLYWNVRNAASCTVVGSNGDGTAGSSTGAWTSMFSGASGKESSAIESRTIYTLRCQSFPGVTPSTIQESATVNVLPVFQEN